jgi:hypothetical protein
MRFIQIVVGQLAAEMPFGAWQYMIYTSPTQRRHREYPGSDHWKAFARRAAALKRRSRNNRELEKF